MKLPRLAQRLTAAAVMVAVASPIGAALAQQAPAAEPQQLPRAAAPSDQPAHLAPPPSNWNALPRMGLERQFAGPLQDTVIQRWRDPADGTICYIYLPITAQHTPPLPSGYVQYGANSIGSITCFAATPSPIPNPATGPKSTGGRR